MTRKLAEYKLDPNLIKANIEGHFNRLNRSISREKKKSAFVEMYKGFAASAATALLGIGQIKSLEQYNDAFQVAAILVTAMLAVVTAWDNLFQHRKLWVMNVYVRNQFASLLDEFLHAEATESLGQNQLEVFQAEMKKILESSNEAWTQLRTDGNEE